MDIPKDFSPPPVSLLKARNYHPVIKLPKDYDVYDFTRSYDPHRERKEFGIGRFNEHRPAMYDQLLFQDGEEPRTVHMGIDIGAPAGTPVHGFMDGVLMDQHYHSLEGDYGATLITEHHLEGSVKLFALWGHLSRSSLKIRQTGQAFRSGDVLGYVGEKNENGGWNPHLHLQLSWIRPVDCNLPGVVKLSDRESALKIFPDPLHVLGPLY